MSHTAFSLIVSAMTVCAAALAGNAPFRRGNVNGDAALDLSDPVALLGHLFLGEPGPTCPDAADANDDGKLDVADAIHLLAHLFQGGAAPPPPSAADPCPGFDPTADALGCPSGGAGGTGAPSLELHAVEAPPPGVRQRSRLPLPRGPGGEYRVRQGLSFALLVVATASQTTGARVLLEDPAMPGTANPRALRVVCDRTLGDSASGGAVRGEDLSPRFFGVIDGWSDPAHLEEHATLRISGRGPLAPLPGRYAFRATVIDQACASSEAALELQVIPPAVPEVFAWVEEGPEPSGVPLAHDPGTGNPGLPVTGGILVIEVDAGTSPVAPASRPRPRILAEPEIAADLSGLLADPRSASRWSLPLGPLVELFPRGNTELAIEIAGDGSTNAGHARLILERSISHAADVQPLWDRHCTGCHEQPDPEKGLELVAPGEDPARLRRRIVNAPAAEPEVTSTAPFLVRPYAPAASYLYRKLEGSHLEPGVGGEGERMPQAPGEYLAPESLRLVRDWILQGAE